MAKERQSTQNAVVTTGGRDNPPAAATTATPPAPPLPPLPPSAGAAPGPGAETPGQRDYYVVATGVDTLVVGYMVNAWRDPDAMEQLVKAKKEASAEQFMAVGYALDWYGWKFEVMPRGSRGYEWQMYNGDIALRIAKTAESGRRFPEIYITYRAPFLWREGWVKATIMVQEWLEKWAALEGEKVSRVDLTCDVAGGDGFPDLNLRKECVTFAKTRATWTSPQPSKDPEWVPHQEMVDWAHGVHPTSYRIGSGKLLARVYDKTDEIKKKHTEWWRDLWRLDGWDGVGDVTRTEFQVRREMLKEFSVDTVQDLVQRMSDMWRYFTHDWMRLLVLKRGRHDRWKTLPLWKVIRAATIRLGECLGILRFKQKQADYTKVWAQGRGCVITMGALVASVTSVPEAMWKLREEIREFLNDPDLETEIEKRVHKLANAGPARDYLVNEAVQGGAKVNGSSF